jgi:hypothetical protein
MTLHVASAVCTSPFASQNRPSRAYASPLNRWPSRNPTPRCSRWFVAKLQRKQTRGEDRRNDSRIIPAIGRLNGPA